MDVNSDVHSKPMLSVLEKASGLEILSTVTPTIDLPEPSTLLPSNGHSLEKPTPLPPCVTQNPVPPAFAALGAKNGIHDIMVGLKGTVPRWVPGSVIRWVALSDTFRTPKEAEYTAQQLALAAKQWNDAKVGVVFEWVQDPKEATFALVYGGASGQTLARAFFPNSEDLSLVSVYKTAYVPEYKPYMWKILTHELGHVLGLRHEFALGDVETTAQGPEFDGAVRIDEPNKASVMNYREELPELHPCDITSTRKFYSMTDDACGNPPKVGVAPIVDFTPL